MGASNQGWVEHSLCLLSISLHFIFLDKPNIIQDYLSIKTFRYTTQQEVGLNPYILSISI